MLTPEDRDDLYTVIAATIGHDTTLKNSTPSFNYTTVEVVEAMVSATAECNGNMKLLLSGLTGGSAVLAKGMLKKILRRLSKQLRDEKVTLRGMGCIVVSNAHWKHAILYTTLGQ